MASLSKPSLVWYIALFLMLATNIRVHSQTSFSFSFDETILTYQADAYVPPKASFLRLTKSDQWGGPTQNSLGRALYTLPVQFLSSTGQQTSFVTTIQFVVSSNRDGGADGLAFFIAPVNSPVGAGASNFGVFDENGRGPNIFAVEFDTYGSGDFEPDYPHIGIDIESKYSVNTTKFNSEIPVVSATIIYNAATHLITVGARNAFGTASVTYTYNLASILPQWVQVGISASNGENQRINGVFSLLNWSFISTFWPFSATTANATTIRETETYSPHHLPL